jgi:hypothetical protein
VSYCRIPITDECAPEEKDFDEMIENLRDLGDDVGIVMNCQMGRGRTTTGLICAHLIMNLKKLQSSTPSLAEPDHLNPNYSNGEWKSNFNSMLTFVVVLRLVALIENGLFVKWQVDQAIDKCGAVQNLRTAVVEEKDRCAGDTSSKYLKRALNYLERYFWLIVFNAYLNEVPAMNINFSAWMKGRWGLKKLLRKIELS